MARIIDVCKTTDDIIRNYRLFELFFAGRHSEFPTGSGTSRKNRIGKHDIKNTQQRRYAPAHNFPGRCQGMPAKQAPV